MEEDRELIRAYCENGSEEAFSELVDRHINMVFGVAIRRVGDSHLAEEITQNVFVLLARKARRLDHHCLAGWLHRTAGLEAANAMRTEHRRKRREEEYSLRSRDELSGGSTWATLLPLLDEGLNRLRPVERESIILRYLEGRNLREVGIALGLTEDAAQKRVSRALDKLAQYFRKKSAATSVTAASLAIALTSHQLSAAPAGCVAACKASASSLAAASTPLTTALFIMNKAKAACVVGSAFALSMTATILCHDQLQEPRTADSVDSSTTPIAPADVEITSPLSFDEWFRYLFQDSNGAMEWLTAQPPDATRQDWLLRAVSEDPRVATLIDSTEKWSSELLRLPGDLVGKWMAEAPRAASAFLLRNEIPSERAKGAFAYARRQLSPTLQCETALLFLRKLEPGDRWWLGTSIGAFAQVLDHNESEAVELISGFPPEHQDDIRWLVEYTKMFSKGGEASSGSGTAISEVLKSFSGYRRILQEAVAIWSDRDPEAAYLFLVEDQDRINPAGLISYGTSVHSVSHEMAADLLDSIGNREITKRPDSSSGMYHNLVEVSFRGDPERTFSWLEKHYDTFPWVGPLSVRSVVLDNPGFASSWLQSASPSPMRDMVAESVAGSQTTDPDLQFAWAKFVDDPKHRATDLGEIITKLAYVTGKPASELIRENIEDRTIATQVKDYLKSK